MVNDERYEGYYLVRDMDIEEVGFDEIPKRRCSRACWILSITISICVLVFLFILVFVALPLAFMSSITLQQWMVFTHFGLPDNKTFFERFRFPSYKNEYVEVTDFKTNNNISLGVWHILPEKLAYEALHYPHFDYGEALMHSNYSVLIYFHGTGESRADSSRKYQLMSSLFHVITFDYRSYADSSKGYLSEREVVNDCLELYYWVKNKTKSPIYFWGHSLGASIATHTAADLEDAKQPPQALILESAFTSMRDALYEHNISKFFAWLPWFEATVVKPLMRNGFVFDTAYEIAKVSSPIMILHAQDDGILPVKFGRELYKIAYEKSPDTVVYHEFNKKEELDHIFIYQDPFVKYYLMDFINLVEGNVTTINWTRRVHSVQKKSLK